MHKRVTSPLIFNFFIFWTFSFFLNVFSKVGGTSLWIMHVIGKYTIWAPFSFVSQRLFFSTFSFLNFFQFLGKLVFERWKQFAIKYSVYNFDPYLPSLVNIFIFLDFLVFLNFFWQVEKSFLLTLDAICYEINNFTLLCHSLWKFLFF